MSPIDIRPATLADIPALHLVIERAYRGETARSGWTHEADMLDGQRIERATLDAILDAPGEQLLVADRGGTPIGCVQVSDRGDGLTYLGLLCIDPTLQAGGLGRQLLDAAERIAVARFGARTMEMTVIDRRSALIAYYERRGYTLTGESRPFPIAVVPPLRMAVLAKALAGHL